MGRFDSVTGPVRRAAWWASTSTGLAWLFAAGLAIRLLLAPSQGFPFDMASFGAWAGRLAEEGPLGFYPQPGEEFFVDYPPGYLWVLWLLGTISGGVPPAFLLKLPAILADLGVAWVAVLLAVRLTAPALRRRFPVRGAVAAAILLNPAVFFLSAVWGQVDSILALLVLGGFLLLGTGAPTLRREAAGIAVLALAIGTKPQGVFVVPFVLLVLVWRHVRGRVAERQERRGRTAPALTGLGRVAVLGAVGLATGVALMASFGKAPLPAFRFLREAVGTYEVTSVFAFNVWGMVGFWRPDLTGPEAVRLFGLVPAFYIGLAAFLIGAVLLAGRAWISLRRGELDGRVLLFGAMATTCVAFAVLTRIHERYLFLAVACLAPFLAYRGLRRAFYALSALYLVNIYFPYVYYLEYQELPAPKIGPIFDALYGSGFDSVQIQALSLGTALVCLFVAARGWTWLEQRSGTDATIPAEPEPARGSELVAEQAALPEVRESRPWTLTLHPVGRRGAALGLVVFLLVLATRLAWIGDPPGMYFDEVYHARTGGEYLEGRDVYEWTHPPLAKELMALSILGFAGFDARAGEDPPPVFEPELAASDGRIVAWAVAAGGQANVYRGRVRDCRIEPVGSGVPAGIRPSAAAVTGGLVLVGGEGREGPALAAVGAEGERWRIPLPSSPAKLVALDDTVFALAGDGSLVAVPLDDVPIPVAAGVADVAADRRDGVVWASFPDERAVASYGGDGTQRARVVVSGAPGAVVAPEGTGRVLVADTDQARIESIDTEAGSRQLDLPGSAERMATVPGTGLVWAVTGTEVRVIEPRGLSTIGRTELRSAPAVLLPDERGRQLLAPFADEGMGCLGGRAASAWRFGSAVFGAAMAALAALIALRLAGSVLAGGLAGLFVAVDGLAFVLSRIAMNDSYVTAFILAAWFCALSCLYRAGPTGRIDPGVGTPSRPGTISRPAALVWLLGCGLFAGAAVASKWVGVYGMVGVGLLFLWDLRLRGRDGVWGLAGHPVGTLFVFALTLGVLPIAVYVASYIPYFALGNSLGDLVGLQQSMYHYHSRLDATHPFGSPWFGWPFGHRAVWLYLADEGGRRAEIWTAANPVVFFGGLVAMVAVGLAALRRRSAALAVIVLAAAIQYLPWTIVGRVVFLYHYLPVVPFLAVALGWWIAVGRGSERPVARDALLVGGAAVLAFVVLLPALAGIAVPPGYLDGLKRVLFWMF